MSGETSYDVRVWKAEKYVGKKVTTYRVVWLVERQRHRRNFRTTAAAESFRSELLTAARKGEAFDIASGMPVSTLRKQANPTTWAQFATEYASSKWPRASATYRRSIAEALMTITLALTDEARGRPDEEMLRRALRGWAFNHRRRTTEQAPTEIEQALAWLERNTRPVADLADPALCRKVLDSLTVSLDGTMAAATTVARKRAVLSNAIGLAVERGLLTENPLEKMTWRLPKARTSVDRRSVVSPFQARMLLQAVQQTPRSGPRLRAFFAVMYYAGLRPEEAVNLRTSHLELPEKGRGWITLDRATPDAGRDWTDTGRQRDDRQLKHRAAGDTRRVPSPAVLTEILHEHLDTFGADPAGRLFTGEYGGPISTLVYSKVWNRARQSLFTPGVYASPLARRPYDLRHAAVSTWLNNGIAPTQVAEWAGHSVAVLLDVYAKCIDGQEELALRRLDLIGGEW